MNQQHIAALTRTMTSVPSRRDVLRGLAAIGLGLGLGRRPRLAEAGKRPTAAAEPKPNKFGCLNVGDRCRRASQCCSGICKRRSENGKKKCRAHDQSICTPERNYCTSGVQAQCSGLGRSLCWLTTGQAGFCGDITASVPELCRDCSRDTDCQEEFGPGAACIDLTDGLCRESCPDTGGTACFPSGLASPARASASGRDAGGRSRASAALLHR